MGPFRRIRTSPDCLPAVLIRAVLHVPSGLINSPAFWPRGLCIGHVHLLTVSWRAAPRHHCNPKLPPLTNSASEGPALLGAES
jgi:hypothetical protein